MSVEKINSPKNRAVPQILSHATKVPGLIFISGQVPVDIEGAVVPGGIQEHTVRLEDSFNAYLSWLSQAQCIFNLGNVLEAAGSSWDKVVKVNIYLKNMDHFVSMNETYEKVRSLLSSRITSSADN
ncbi:hypothetical protein C0992_011111 [Termitomyces sp. T32_za158]|nr:hypothetical protein C0992_011111 [Termitomyces sp. T32_za158]